MGLEELREVQSTEVQVVGGKDGYSWRKIQAHPSADICLLFYSPYIWTLFIPIDLTFG
jgi:hypothetical protein